MLDFKKILLESQINNTLNPREIFMSLPNKKYDYPRDVQTEVWQQWMEKRNEKDIIIKMNTGSGKTVVGLIILKSCIREDKKPAVYVVPNNYLVSQVIDEARSLGIEVTDDSNDIAVLTGEKILITNIYKLVNGKSIFGLSRKESNLKIGSIIIDDVHACLNAIESQYTLEFSMESDMYSKIYKLFEEDIIKQSPNKVVDIENGDPGISILVPYWAWHKKFTQVYEIISNDNNNDNQFKLPLIRDYFNLCNCVISTEKIEISPKSININDIDGFKRAERRIYMSATIASMTSLITKCGISNYPQNVIKPKYSDDMGERFILIPQLINNTISDEQIKIKVKELSKKHNVVVIVPADYRKEFWKDVVDVSIDKDNLEYVVTRLKNEHVGLVIMSNRYEGIDLPNKSCEVLVIDGVPSSKRKCDEIEQQMIGNTSKVLNRRIQLIEQGMGRGVRSSSDYCGVILMGSGLVSTLYADGYIDKMSNITKKQIKLSEQISNQLKGSSIDEIFDSLNYCLNRDQEWITTSKSLLAQVEYTEESSILDIENILAECFELAKGSQYKKIKEKLDLLINSQEDLEVQGYLKMQLAEYWDFVNECESQEILKSAYCINNKVLKPIDGIEYRKHMINQNSQIDNIIGFVKKWDNDFNKIIFKLNEISEKLVFESENANVFEKALADIGEYIGLKTERPESDTGVGPDVLWWINEKNAMVIECKNMVLESNDICKKDCNQLNGSVEWFNNYYGQLGIIPTPILVHPSNVYERDCSPKQETLIITPTKLQELKNNVYKFIRELGKSTISKDNIFNLLNANNLYGEKIIGKNSVKYEIKK